MQPPNDTDGIETDAQFITDWQAWCKDRVIDILDEMIEEHQTLKSAQVYFVTVTHEELMRILGNAKRIMPNIWVSKDETDAR